MTAADLDAIYRKLTTSVRSEPPLALTDAQIAELWEMLPPDTVLTRGGAIMTLEAWEQIQEGIPKSLA